MFTSATIPCSASLPASIGIVALVLLLSSCTSMSVPQRAAAPGAIAEPLPRQSIVFVIHGDGDYVFHDADGLAHRADEEGVAGAVQVAERNPDAEVFIFHQKRRRHTLFLFARRDGEFRYYRGGRLVAQESYWRDHGDRALDPEVELHDRFRADDGPRSASLFLYLGHEIPEYGGAGYDASYRKRAFTVGDLADGVRRMSHDSKKFDVIVLATCFGGTPHTVAALAPYARTLIASPDVLHLSYFDLQPLERLGAGMEYVDSATLARGFARRAFDRLSSELLTAVTVSVYDADRVQPYLDAVGEDYDRRLATLSERSPGFAEHGDCAGDPTFARPDMADGVDVFYRAPRFGRQSSVLDHSGWQCWRLPE